MDMLECHVNYAQDQMIVAENKVTEAWTCLQSYMKSNDEVGGVYLSC